MIACGFEPDETHSNVAVWPATSAPSLPAGPSSWRTNTSFGLTVLSLDWRYIYALGIELETHKFK